MRQYKYETEYDALKKSNIKTLKRLLVIASEYKHGSPDEQRAFSISSIAVELSNLPTFQV